MRTLRVLVACLVLAVVAVGGGLALVRPWETNPIVGTIPVGHLPWQGTVDELSGRAFILNLDDQTLSVLDTHAATLVHTVPLPARPYFLAVAPHLGRVYVALSDSGQLAILDARSGALLRTVWLGRGVQPPNVDERTGHVVVANGNDGTVSLLDARSGALLHSTAVNNLPDGIALDAQTARAFVCGGDGTVATLDLHTGRLLRTVLLGPRPDTEAFWPVVVPSTGRVFVPSPLGQNVSVLDARSGALLRTIPLGFTPTAADDRDTAALLARTGQVIVAGVSTRPADAIMNTGPGRVAFLDARNGAVRRIVPVDASPTGVIGNAVTGHVVVATRGPVRGAAYLGTGYVDVLDGHSGALLRRLPVEANPQVIMADVTARHAFAVNVNSNWPLGSTPLRNRHTEAPWQLLARDVKRIVPWLPFSPPKPPAPSLTGSVTVLDLSHL